MGEKLKYVVEECEVCDWWSDKLGCFKDETEEFGECFFKPRPEVEKP